MLEHLDPRRSLASAIGWLAFTLSIGLVLVASVWVGDIVRANLLDMRGRQLDRAADDIADELNLSLALKRQSVRALAAMLVTELRVENRATLRRILENLRHASAEFESIVVADRAGRVLASTGPGIEGTSVAGRPWFALALQASKIGEVKIVPASRPSPDAADGTPDSAVDLVAPLVDANGATVGVVGMEMDSHWLLDLARSHGARLRGESGTDALVLDKRGTVLIGAAAVEGTRFATTLESASATDREGGVYTYGGAPRLEQLADGSRYLVARVFPEAPDPLQALGWRIVVLQPLQLAMEHARFLQAQLTAVLLGLGMLAALLGVFLARRVTRDLDAIARSADAVRTGVTPKFVVPPGRNEAARLARALDELLASLERERHALKGLNAELDQRVAARTRDVERLSEQARNAALVRQRLKIARDLHDTLAHSMMAMLTEVRLLKRLSVSDPGALAEELTRAEELAQQGLNEARAAITQMRFNPVRDVGFAAAMGDLVQRFVERSGIAVDFTSDAQPGTFADETAETLFRIAEEALRNIERHAGATRVTVALRRPAADHGLTLQISDDGVGFDTSIARPGHYGLKGLREQVQVIGATLSIHSAPRQGTAISVVLARDTDA